jgi:hypothetical protein
MFSRMLPDLRFVLRSALRRPFFAAVVIVTLALGIGANTPMFSTIHAVLIKPLPYKDPGRLVFASCTLGGETNPMASAPDYYDYREQADIPVWAANHPPATPGDQRLAHARIVLPGYFHSLRIPLMSGRDLEKTDREHAPLAMIINELMATTLFPDINPLGQRVMVDIGGQKPVPFEVIGIVGDARIDAIGRNAPMTMYLSYYQFPRETLRFGIRTEQDPELIARTVRRLVSARDRDIPVENLVSMERLIGDSLVPQRVSAITLTLFSAVALLLACIGLYGVLAYYVSQRTHELGVRMSLGAGTKTVMMHVLARSGMMVLPGLGLGLAGSLAGARLIEQLLYEVPPIPLILAPLRP